MELENEKEGKKAFSVPTKFCKLLVWEILELCFISKIEFTSYLCVTLIGGHIHNRVNNVTNLFLFREKEMESFASVIMANRSSIELLNYHQQWGTPLG